MFHRNLIRLSSISLQAIAKLVEAIALFTVVFSRSANSQGLGFDIDYNQSRQFFESGSEKIEEEINKIEAYSDRKLPIIKLPAEYFQDKIEDIENKDRNSLSFIDEYQYVEYADVGMRSN